jgi:hypothetical protein
VGALPGLALHTGSWWGGFGGRPAVSFHSTRSARRSQPSSDG